MAVDEYLVAFPLTSIALLTALFISGSQLSRQDAILMSYMSLTSFFIYPFIWFYPSVLLSLCRSPEAAVQIFKYIVAMHKIGLVAVMQWTGWLDLKVIMSVVRSSLSASPILGALALVLLAAGLWLQGLVYKKIGASGVYYGFKMGIDVPWCEEFPFTKLRHPQYVSASSIFTALLIGVGWRNTSPILLTYQLWLYSVTAKMEEYGDQDSKISSKKKP